MGGYTFALRKSSLDLQMNVSNLLNRTYFDASGPFTRSHIAPGTPTAVISSLRFNF
jgi:outer membrane receptor for monomeric catechols